MSITRYGRYGGFQDQAWFVDRDGPWVTYPDHAAEMQEAYRLIAAYALLHSVPAAHVWLDAHKEYQPR